MASRHEVTRWVAGLAATLLSAAGWWFGAQLHPLWWAAWLAPLPVLWLATRVRARWAALAALAAPLLGALHQWHYLHGLLRLPLSVLGLALLGQGVVFALATLLYRRLALRGRHLWAALAVPAVVGSLSFLNAMTSIDGTWGDLAYTQIDALPVIQVAALTGLWGIGFLVLLAPACVAVACDGTAPGTARWRTALAGGALIALALGYGTWRLHASTGEGDSVRVGLVSLQGPFHPVLGSPEGQGLVKRYADAAEALADAGAQVVVIPETVVAVTTPSVPALETVAQRHGITVLAGVDYRPPGGPERNMSMAMRPQAHPPATYWKHHLVAHLEDRFTPGDGYTMLAGAPHTGLAICKDMDFPAMGRSYAARDAQLLLVPAWDFDADDWLHSRMAILRGVESGFAIARAARDGRLTLSDDRGRVLAQASSVDSNARLLGTLPLHHTHTLYGRWGNWFAWLELALATIALTMAVLPRSRHL